MGQAAYSMLFYKVKVEERKMKACSLYNLFISAKVSGCKEDKRIFIEFQPLELKFVLPPNIELK